MMPVGLAHDLGWLGSIGHSLLRGHEAIVTSIDALRTFPAADCMSQGGHDTVQPPLFDPARAAYVISDRMDDGECDPMRPSRRASSTPTSAGAASSVATLFSTARKQSGPACNGDRRGGRTRFRARTIGSRVEGAHEHAYPAIRSQPRSSRLKRTVTTSRALSPVFRSDIATSRIDGTSVRSNSVLLRMARQGVRFANAGTDRGPMRGRVDAWSLEDNEV